MRGASLAVALASGALALATFTTPALAQSHPAIETRTQAFRSLPFWPGYWVSESMAGTSISGISSAASLTGSAGNGRGMLIALMWDTTSWNEEGLRRVAAQRAQLNSRKSLGWGYPMMMNSGTPLAFVITPELVLIANAYNEIRYVYTDGRTMPAEDDMWPTTWGTSIGHWEGETLVVETRMVKDPSQFFQAAPPFSEAALYEERFTLDGERLLMEFTVTDPTTLREPYHASFSYVREEAFDRMIQVDWDNDRTGNDGSVNTIEAVAVGQ